MATAVLSLAAAGASVAMEQAAPGGVAADGHSLQELSVQTSGGTAAGDTIEIGVD